MSPSFLDSLAASGRGLPGHTASHAQRQAALAEFAAAGLPTPRQENWRYTDLRGLAAAGFEVVPGAPTRTDLQAAATLLEAAALGDPAQRLVFVDGHRAAELGQLSGREGFEVHDLDHQWGKRHPPLIATAEHPLATLNSAFTQQGAWLRVGDGQRIAEPVHIIFIGSGRSGLAPQPRLIIELGRGAQLTVVQHCLDASDPTGWLNSVTHVEQAADSQLFLYRVQEHGQHQSHTALLAANLAARAQLSVGYADLGGRLVRNDVDVKLSEPGARAEIFGVFLAAAGQHVDEHTRVDHLAPETHSDELFRGVIGSRGRGVFNGKVVVHRNAQRIEAHQSNDNLLLADNAEIDTKPELEIYADDVKCSHGTTVGELDTEQLFYLRSRGVDETAARDLLIAAFAASVLERIPNESLRNRITECVAARLRTLEQPT